MLQEITRRKSNDEEQYSVERLEAEVRRLTEENLKLNAKLRNQEGRIRELEDELAKAGIATGSIHVLRSINFFSKGRQQVPYQMIKLSLHLLMLTTIWMLCKDNS
jgi:predicted nuclease with TOPRIM domain